MAAMTATSTVMTAPKRKSTSAGLSNSGRPVKRRASKACQCCRSRKVRCDVVESGIPCTNCRLDEVECLVTEGKRRKKSCIDNDLIQHSPTESAEEREDISQFPMFDDIDGLQDLTLPYKPCSTEHHRPHSLEHDLNHHQPHMLYQQAAQKMSPEERARRLSMASQSRTSFSSGRLPSDSQAAPYSSVPPRQEVSLPRYIQPLPNRILSEDVEYLQKKGAFLIPDISLRNELLRCYVQYVHPYLPLVDLEEFLSAIEKNDGSSTVSLLLFQAVMFAATAYVDLRFLAAQGYDSRKSSRKAFFSRVKLLYDFDYETDRVTVVQAVLLMTYWYESPDDPKDIWHWLGVAISLARTIGLNCNTTTSPLSIQKQRLWKRIWWSCYMRDRLIAIGMRRPIRIRDDEYDVPMLEVSDFETHSLSPSLCRMLGGCSAVRDSAKRELLAKMCVAVVRCCQCITHVLTAQYSTLGHRLGATQETTVRLVPRKSAADPTEVIRCDRELELWYNTLPQELKYFSTDTPRERNIRNDGEVLNLHRALLTGIYLTTSSALHRPQMMPAMPNLVIAPELKDLSKRRVRDAATAITDIFRDLYSHDLIRYMPNTAVTILLPAIIIHLLDIKSPDSATRQLSVRRFQFCMLALQKLRDMYASADFAFSFLDAAIEKAELPVTERPADAHNTKQTLKPAPSFKTLLKSTPTQLTPPPDSAIPDSGMFGSFEGRFVFPPATTMPSESVQRGSFAALSPPNSDRSAHSSASAPTLTAPNILAELNFMNQSPPASIHSNSSDEQNMGYVEADSLEDLDMVDEEAMRNDFDQLINLEGGSSGINFFADGLQAIANKPGQNGDWLNEESSPKDITQHSSNGETTMQGDIVIPMTDPNDAASPIFGGHGYDTDGNAKLMASLVDSKTGAAQLRNEMIGDSLNQGVHRIGLAAA